MLVQQPQRGENIPDYWIDRSVSSCSRRLEKDEKEVGRHVPAESK